MRYVNLANPEKERPLNFYLAVEEWLARNGKPGDEYFFLWQVKPTIICGRNQVVENEVDVDYCRAHGVDMVRRRSGGGAVYADMNNIMFSYVTLPEHNGHPGEGRTVATTFSHYTSLVADMLRSLGLDATTSPRNDVWIQGRKVSGYAFYNVPQGSIVHGTMLYDFDPEAMGRCLTPTRSKLSSKGVKSVESHVTTIKEHLPKLSIEEFKDTARRFMGIDGTLTLDEKAEREIEAIAAEYRRPDWLFRMKTDRELPPVQRIEGVGEFIVDVETDKDNVIRRVNLMGDFFLVSELDAALLDLLIGVKRERQDITRALRGVHVADVIHGLDNDTFIDLLLTPDVARGWRY